MLPDSKVVDAPPHKISIEQTVGMAREFELLVLFTSTPGFDVDCRISEMMKESNPKLKVCFVGPPVTVEPEKTPERRHGHRFRHPPRVRSSDRRLCQRQAARRDSGRELSQERQDRQQSRSADRSRIWTRCRGLRRSTSAISTSRNYNVPFLLNPFISMYTSRGCPAMCTFCLWPQTHSGHRWRLRSSDDICNEVKYALGSLSRR